VNVAAQPFNRAGAEPRLWDLTRLDLRLWVYALLLFSVYRLWFIQAFWAEISGPVTRQEILGVLLQGMRFDATWATIALLFSWLCITLPTVLFCRPFRYASAQLQRNRQYLQRLRWLWGALVTTGIVVISLVSVEYYREYHDLFNESIFGIVTDDQWAIFKTLLRYYPLFSYIGLLALMLLAYHLLAKIWLGADPASNLSGLRLTPPPTPFIKSCGYFICFTLFCVVGFRGSLGARPMQLKDAGVSRETVLNKAVLNPATALRYAIKAHRQMQGTAGLTHWLPEGKAALTAQVPAWLKQVGFPLPEKDKVLQIDTLLQRTVQQEAAHKPKHIFVMVMESYDAWPLLPEYEHLHIADGVKSLVQSGGISFPHFTSASAGTMSSLAAILTGLPDAQVNTNYQANARKAYPTALAQQFKKLGYKTRLFYGGYLSWQRIEDFARDQGIDEVYGASHMASWIRTNEWGVPDQHLFDFITEKSSDVPTLNIILSTSNHPPFSVNLKEAGFNEARMKTLLDTHYPASGASAKTLGHFWYADKVLTEFVQKMAQQEPESLFVITGDHFGRRHVKPNPPLYETKAVVSVWYGPRVLKAYQNLNTADRAGGHLDIGPTLIEMAAPKGFRYPSMGRNLFAQHPDRLNLGLGNGILMLPGYRVWTWDPNAPVLGEIGVVSKQSVSSNSIVSNHHDVYYRAMMSLAWWNITQGEALP
jgi:hypothetical protein